MNPKQKLWLTAVRVLAILAVSGGICAPCHGQETIGQRPVAETPQKDAPKAASAKDFALAGLKMEKGDWPAALAYLADALRKDPQNNKATVRAVSLICSIPLPVAMLQVNAFVIPSPDGKWAVTGSGDTAQVWDVQTNRPIGLPMKQGGSVDSASFSPDGKWVLTVSEDLKATTSGNVGAIVQAWDAETGQPAGQPIKYDGPVYSAHFSPDGKRALTVSTDAVRVWDVQTGQLVGQPMTYDTDDLVPHANFSPDGKWVLTASDDTTTRVWDAQTGQPVSSPMQHDKLLNSATFSPDGKWVVTASEDHTARVWDARTGQPISPPMKHDDRVNSASFSPDGRWVVTASDDKTARVWDAQTGQPVGLPKEHDNGVFSADFSPDNKRIVTVSKSGARVWGTQSSQLDPDDKRVVTASNDNAARLSDVAIADQPAPAWLGDLAEACGGQRLNSQGRLEPALQDPVKLRQELQKLTGDDGLSRFGRWLVADPFTRAISPLSTITVPEFVAARLQENTFNSVEEAYRMDPGNPLVLAALAKLTFEKDKDKALFYFQVALRYAQLAGAPEPITQVRAMAKLLFPDVPELSLPLK